MTKHKTHTKTTAEEIDALVNDPAYRDPPPAKRVMTPARLTHWSLIPILDGGPCLSMDARLKRDGGWPRSRGAE